MESEALKKLVIDALEELKAVSEMDREISARRGLIIHSMHPVACVHWLRRALVGDPTPEYRQAVTEAIAMAMMDTATRISSSVNPSRPSCRGRGRVVRTRHVSR